MEKWNIRTRTSARSECDTFHGNNMTFVFGETASHLEVRSRVNGPLAASGHMVHAGGQATHWDIQNKATSSR